MTTATAQDLTVPLLGGRHHFLLRRLHSLTGLVFGGYLVVHLAVNASLAQGIVPKDVYQIQVDKIHSLPFLWVVEWSAIFLPIIFHTVYGIWITLTAQPNIDRYPYGKNIYYVLQRISAMIIALFILFHVLGTRGLIPGVPAFVESNATTSVVRHINMAWPVAYIVYPLGVIASCYHLANGFWTGAITWGLTVSAASQRRWGFVCAGIFVFTLVCGLLAVASAISSAGAVH